MVVGKIDYNKPWVCGGLAPAILGLFPCFPRNPLDLPIGFNDLMMLTPSRFLSLPLSVVLGLVSIPPTLAQNDAITTESEGRTPLGNQGQTPNCRVESLANFTAIPWEEFQGQGEPSPPPEATLFVPSQESQVQGNQLVRMDLATAQAIAAANNETVVAATLNVAKAQEALREAQGGQWPSLNTSATFQNSESTTTGLESTSITGNLELSYNLYTGGRRGAQIRAAEKQLTLQSLALAQARQDLSLAVSNAYYNLQNADAQVLIEQSAVNAAQKGEEDAINRQKAGIGTKFDVLQAQVERANFEQNLTRALADQKLARRQLAQLLSLEVPVSPITSEEIQPSPGWNFGLEETILMALNRREELEQIRLQKDIAREQEIVNMSTVRPQINVFANYNTLDVFNDNTAAADGYTVGARLNWVLFNGGTAQAQRNQAVIDGDLAENAFDRQRNQIRLNVEEAYFLYESNRENIDTAGKSVELALERCRLADLRLGAGVGTQKELIDAQSDLSTAQNNFLRSVTEYNRARARLEREVGGTLEPWNPDEPVIAEEGLF